MTLILRAATVTDPGLVRTNNEDVGYASHRLIAVADGIGGQPAGELASAIAVRTLAALDQAPVDDDPVAALRAAVGAANQEIRAATATDPASDGMGTTLTAALLHGDQLALVHIGDSRGYLFRDGLLHQLTKDDTYVQTLVDQGILTAEEAWAHPQRSVITNAVRGNYVVPSTGMVPVRAGDRLLVCSDGLSDYVPGLAIAQALAIHSEPQQCAEQLVKLVHQAGAPDNVTVVVADVVPYAPVPVRRL